MRRFASLRRQADFVRLRRRGRRASTPILTMYCAQPMAGDRTSLVGISVGKPVGKAVVRNTVRRRLAAAVQEALAGRPPMRLLLVPQPAAAGASYGALAAGVFSALDRLGTPP